MMKKIMLFAGAIAALVACSKEAETVVDANHFEKGQKVTLTVKAGEPSTKVSSKLNEDGETVDFKWQAGDVIKVTVGESSAGFTLSSGAGEAEATFTGTMPASGTTFDVQYPAGDTPDLASQTYSGTEALPHDKMLFTAENCSLSASNLDLTAKYSALRLNLWGTSQTVSKIVVTNTTSSETPKPSYTLNISDGVTLPTTEDAAKAFFIVVPAGSWNFSAEFFDNAATPASICTLEKTSMDKYFTANYILNMPAKEVKVIPEGAVDLGLTVYWATCNIGADSPEKYGTYFAWGDVAGQTWNSSSWSDGGFSTYHVYELDANNNLKPEYDAAHVNLGSTWRMPTKAEFEELYSNCTFTLTDNYNETGVAGIIFTSKKEGYTDKSIFLPSAGYGDDEGRLLYTGSLGSYWSSTFDYGNYAKCFTFHSGGVNTTLCNRMLGQSVRPVTE